MKKIYIILIMGLAGLFIFLTCLYNFQFISVQVSYKSDQEGTLKLYYSEEDERFSENNTLTENINVSSDINVANYYFYNDNFSSFRFDLEDGLETIYISKVSIKFIGISIISYDAQQFIDCCSIVKQLELTLEDGFAKVDSIDEDPYITIENVNLSKINIILLILIGLCAVAFIILLFLHNELSTNIVKGNKVIYSIFLFSIALLLIIKVLSPISINVSYLSSQDGTLKLYYSYEDESFNEINSLTRNIVTKQNLNTASYNINDIDITSFRLDLEEGLETLYVKKVSINFLGIPVLSYNAQQFIDSCSIVKQAELTLEDEVVKIESTGDDPYIGIDNLDFSIINQIIVYVLSLMSILLLLIAFCEKKYTLKKMTVSLLLISILSFFLNQYFFSFYYSVFVAIIITLILFILTVKYQLHKQH